MSHSLFYTPDEKTGDELVEYFVSLGLDFIVQASKADDRTVNNMITEIPYKPNLSDLYRLHAFILINRRITALEIGCGWSSFVIAHALEINSQKYLEQVKSFRRNNPFELHVLDNEQRFIDIAERRLIDNELTNASFIKADVEAYEYQGRLTTRYSKLPFINPDFIYLDGPDQFNIKNDIRGLSTAHKDFMPMSSDIVLFEHFLVPGTMIIVDGRAANARMLRKNFQRDWYYQYDSIYDQHIFYLDEEPLGKYNRMQLEFWR